jgi:cytochrome c-type biogenesis protein CcmH/NrfG
LHRGDIYAAQRKIADAKKAYQQVVKLDPKSPMVATAQARLKILNTPAKPRSKRKRRRRR